MAFDRVALTAAGPDEDDGKGMGEPAGEFLDAGALRRVMAGEDQADPERSSLQGTMETGLAGQEGVGTHAGGIVEKIITGAAGDCQPLDPPSGVARELESGRGDDPCYVIG